MKADGCPSEKGRVRKAERPTGEEGPDVLANVATTSTQAGTPALLRKRWTDEALASFATGETARRSWCYARVLRKRPTAKASTTTPRPKSAANCGQSTPSPTPFRKIPRTITNM